MDEHRMARMLVADVIGGLVQGRPRLRWMDGVKAALGSRGMTVGAARQNVKDRNEWKALMHMFMIQFNAAIFAWTSLPRSCGLSSGEGWDAVT